MSVASKVTAVQDSAGPKLAREHALRQIGIGIVILVVGIVVTAVTYHNAASSPTGGTYLVAWGPMLFGVIAIVRGLRALSRAGRPR